MNKSTSNQSFLVKLATRFSGLLVSLIMIAYFSTLHNSIQASDYINSDNITLIWLLICWTTISIVQVFTNSINQKIYWTFLFTYQTILGLLMTFAVSFDSPLILLWVVFALFSYISLQKAGLILSLGLFMIFSMIDLAMALVSNKEDALQLILYYLFTLVINLSIILIFQTQEITKTKLEKSKAKEALQRDRIQTIVNNLTDAIISTDKSGIIKIFNASCLNILDTNTSLIGKHIDDILILRNKDGKKINLTKELKKIDRAKKRDDLEYWYNEDEKIRLEITLSPIKTSSKFSIKEENHDGYIVIFRDITKAKSLEEERDEFISVTSHELRTPITIAEGTLSNMAIMINHPNATKKMLEDAVSTAHDQVVFLANMVNDLSTLSRAERGVADTAEIIDVKELGYKIYNKYRIEAEQKKLHLNLDLMPNLGLVNASRLYIEELLQNFMTNSLKYTREGSINIKFTKQNNEFNFEVSDTGIGISKSDQAKIFQKFYRSEDYRTRETGGTGLGLYIAMKLSKKLGTKIEVESRLNHGSKFSFKLPEFINKDYTS